MNSSISCILSTSSTLSKLNQLRVIWLKPPRNKFRIHGYRIQTETPFGITLFDDLFYNPIKIKEALKGLGPIKPSVHLITTSFFVGGV
jgi:hypothetical protein